MHIFGYTVRMPIRYQRKNSLRKPGYDYRMPGYYFVTIDTYEKECLFGDVQNGKMILNEPGTVASHHWLQIPKHHPTVQLDEYIVMPNHLHGIIVLKGNPIDILTEQETGNFQPQKKSLSLFIRTYKAAVTRNIHRKFPSSPERIWHRSFHDRIIRNPNELEQVRRYIQRTRSNGD